jgi:hypothetical protein
LSGYLFLNDLHDLNYVGIYKIDLLVLELIGIFEILHACINSAETLLGTPYYPQPDEDIIFFWEPIGQPIEELEVKLVHFRESGLFDKVKGMLIGKFRQEATSSSHCPRRRIKDMTDHIKESVLDITADYNFPIIAGLDDIARIAAALNDWIIFRSLCYMLEETLSLL